MPKISKTLSVMSLLAPVGAHALGVGEIKLHSALNQVLQAEIPIVASGSESTSNIQVRLASASAFARAGIERPFYLSRLRFTPVMKNGRIVVKVVSRDVIREPFLNFLVEVSWPKGRMLREFTVLLDPPATFDQSVITANKAPMVESKTVTTPRYPVDQPSNYGFGSASSRPATAAYNSTPQPVQKRQRPARKQYNAGDAVRSRRNDSLWAIAKRVNSDASISQEQMMVALYEANAQAFYKENMNALKAGQRLKVPSREAALKRSRSQAIAELGRQNDLWSGKLSPASDAKPAESVASSTDGVKQSGSKLELVSPAIGETVAKSSSATSGSGSGGKAELAIELAETVSQENNELRTRLKQLEEQMARMQLMLTLKDQQLSALQSKQDPDSAASTAKIMDLGADKSGLDSSANGGAADKLPGAQTPALNSAPKSDPATGLSGKSDTQPNPEVSAADGTSVDSTAETSVPASVDSEKAVADTDTAAVAPVSNPSANQTATGGSAENDARDRVTPPAEEDLLTELLSEPFYLIAGVGGILLLAALGWAMVRRRNHLLMEETESILAAPDTMREPSATPEVSEDQQASAPVDEVTTVAESSFLSEFTPSDFDALESDHDDVDPISEADVYLAYGRYQQAEDLIRNAIETYPERDECKLKLLEIHYATEDRDSFEAYARELEAYKTDKPEIWAKVAEMGREICPTSDLFGDAGASGDNQLSEVGDASDFSLDSSSEAFDSFDLGETIGQGEEADFGGSVDVDFDATEATGDSAATFETTDSFEAELELAETESGAQVETEDEQSLEFDAPQTDQDDHTIEFSSGLTGESTQEKSDLGELDTTAEFAFKEDEGEQPYDLATSIDSLELDTGENDVEAETANSSSEEFSDLTDMDEIETKLDLAKAYVDMDDKDSARGILFEILAAGNDVQKNEAQALVDVLENKA